MKKIKLGLIFLFLFYAISTLAAEPPTQFDSVEATKQKPQHLDEKEISLILNRLQKRLSPTEESFRVQVQTLEKKLKSISPWLKPSIIIAIVFAVLGWAIAIFQYFGQQKQRMREVLFESLELLTGGTQKRSVGIAVIETKWDDYKEFQRRWLSILISQAIYLLTKDKEKNQEKSARHEHANLYRIMDLLYKHFEMCSYREKELLGKWVNEYGNARGLQDLDENIVKEWKEKFKDSGLTLPSELKGF